MGLAWDAREVIILTWGSCGWEVPDPGEPSSLFEVKEIEDGFSSHLGTMGVNARMNLDVASFLTVGGDNRAIDSEFKPATESIGIAHQEEEFDNSEDENAGNPYTNRGRNDDVIGVLMAYGFSADEMRCARPKKDSLQHSHHKHAEDAQYIPHPCFEREVRNFGTIPSVMQLATQIRYCDVYNQWKANASHKDVEKAANDAYLVREALSAGKSMGFYWSFCMNDVVDANYTWHCRPCHQCMDYRHWHCKRCVKCQIDRDVECQRCKTEAAVTSNT